MRITGLLQITGLQLSLSHRMLHLILKVNSE